VPLTSSRRIARYRARKRVTSTRRCAAVRPSRFASSSYGMAAASPAIRRDFSASNRAALPPSSYSCARRSSVCRASDAAHSRSNTPSSECSLKRTLQPPKSPSHPVPPARCSDVAGRHKLVANKFGKALTARSARAAMLSANRLLVAQPSSAWKQRSYPALRSATLPAFLLFCRDRRKFTSLNTPLDAICRHAQLAASS